VGCTASRRVTKSKFRRSDQHQHRKAQESYTAPLLPEVALVFMIALPAELDHDAAEGDLFQLGILTTCSGEFFLVGKKHRAQVLESGPESRGYHVAPLSRRTYTCGS
jgi:hypothetical protein